MRCHIVKNTINDLRRIWDEDVEFVVALKILFAVFETVLFVTTFEAFKSLSVTSYGGLFFKSSLISVRSTLV